jgi:predicted AlkP superfamily pyrophosphatase or phosphodiesterase
MIKIILIMVIIMTYNISNAKTIVIISIDALHPDAIAMAKPKNISKVMQKSVYTLKGKSVNPPKTLINHTAMMIGKTPEESGYKTNAWKEGDKKVEGETIFKVAKEKGYKTYYVYSKKLLGFLATNDVDEEYFAGKNSTEIGNKIIKEKTGDYLFFWHISGLEFVGNDYGWLSKEYLEEFNYIDEDIADAIKILMNKKNVTLIITSDHSGHQKIHGSNHPEDFKLPLIIYSDMGDFKEYENAEYRTTELKNIIKKIIK